MSARTERLRRQNVGRTHGNPKIKARLLTLTVRCWYCKRPFQNERVVSLDHYMPAMRYPELARDWTNLVLACKPCNFHKSNKEPTEPLPKWYRQAVQRLWDDAKTDALIEYKWAKNTIPYPLP